MIDSMPEFFQIEIKVMRWKKQVEYLVKRTEEAWEV